MADIQLIHCKSQQKTSSNRRNIVPCEEIGVKESNGEVQKQPFLRMPSENVSKNCPKCCQIAKIWSR